MITKEEVRALLQSTETYRIERTTSTGDMDKFQEAICAFANDLPNSRKKGYLILGAYDNGTLSGLKVTDALLKKIAAIRSDGNILPLPIMSVERFEYEDGDLLKMVICSSQKFHLRWFRLFAIVAGRLSGSVLVETLLRRLKSGSYLSVELLIWRLSMQHLVSVLQ